MRNCTRRREFLTLLGGAAACWPLVAHAQQPKRVGVLMSRAATETTSQSQLTIFTQGMRKVGWIEGQNLQTEVRWSAGDQRLSQVYATDFVDLFKPDVLLCHSTSNLAALQRATRTIPIVFVRVADPVVQGFVPNLAHPGGNITGFSGNEFAIAGKWADLIKQMAPSITRVAVVFNPETDPQSKLYVSAVEAAAPSLGVGVVAEPVRSTADLEAMLARVAREPHIGLIFSTGAFLSLRAKLIVETVARYRLPAIYGVGDESFTIEGGLMHYFNDPLEPFRLAPFYVDRILKGTKPGDLPVHLPTKFKFIINRKTASALGIEVPLGLLLAAEEVIE
jgi:putative ABC transport system substrate-binding protein